MPTRTGVTNLPLKNYIQDKDEQLRVITDYGFDSVDYFLTEYKYGVPKNDDEEPINEDYFARKRALLASSGAVVYQTHAPYPIYTGDKEKDAAMLVNLEKSIEATALLGAKYMVVHPAKPPIYRYAFCKPLRKAINMKLLSALLPTLKKHGVVLAIENMFFEDKKGIHPTACSRGDEMLDYLSTLNDPHFTTCYDSGHANLIYHDGGIKLIEELGENISVCHLHDDFGVYDDHLIPGEGKIDWVKLLTALKKTGFRGPLNYETHYADGTQTLKELLARLEKLHQTSQEHKKIWEDLT